MVIYIQVQCQASCSAHFIARLSLLPRLPMHVQVRHSQLYHYLCNTWTVRALRLGVAPSVPPRGLPRANDVTKSWMTYTQRLYTQSVLREQTFRRDDVISDIDDDKLSVNCQPMPSSGQRLNQRVWSTQQHLFQLSSASWQGALQIERAVSQNGRGEARLSSMQWPKLISRVKVVYASDALCDTNRRVYIYMFIRHSKQFI